MWDKKTRRSQDHRYSMQMLVAAPVRARTVELRLRSWVCTTHTGAQWTARPTDSLRLWADWRAAILAAVHTNDRDWLEVIFEGVEAAGPWNR